ncbi:uncharacterized protein [Parasteatoda tepidariorum]|nr:uncharacterized protein LOC107452603 [Parasteatoda tepidariorum]XP_015924600.2 uncharacterized protein LOC107452603 [Parasteatoda tepidariorum]
MKFAALFLIIVVFRTYSANTVDEVNEYFDEVMLQLIQAVEDAGLSLHELPNFTHNMQSRSPDGTVVNAKVLYHSGNLTGLDGAVRENCQAPVWRSGNITAQCQIIVEQIDIKYQAQYQKLTGHSNNVHYRQDDFGVIAYLGNTYASIDITSSPHIRVPSLKNFQITKFGDLEITYTLNDNIPFNQISSHLHNKLRDMVYELFDGKYKEAIGLAVGAVQFPEE